MILISKIVCNVDESKRMKSLNGNYYSNQNDIPGGRVNPRMGPDLFCGKTINVLLKWTLFLAGPHIQAIQISCQLCSNVDIKDSLAHQILQRAH